ncbi:MAG: hypothetical protein EOO05_22440, partial [Chitinophagaceae bacterium]
MLKNQLQPHFLFNTLNSLYGMSLTDSKDTSRFILLLSQMMQYILYDCDQEKVNLKDELEFLNGYFELEQKKFPDAAIAFQSHGSTADIQIPPMLFLPLIENSFKHGVRNTIGSTEIKVCLSISATAVSFRIENPVSTDVNGSGGGIGLRNVRRRLDLLYGDDYKLETCNEAGRYIAALTLPLSVGGAFVNHTGSTIKNRADCTPLPAVNPLFTSCCNGAAART